MLTSIWVHYDVSHYANNMLVFLFFIFVFVFIHEDYPRDEKLRRSKVLIWIPIVSAIAANVYTLIVLPLSSSAGASGALLAYEGVCLGYAFLNWYPSSFKLQDLREHFLKRENRTTIFRSLVVFAVLFAWYVLDSRQFLFAGPGVNVYAHLVGLTCGFGLTGLYEINHRFRKRLYKAGAPQENAEREISPRSSLSVTPENRAEEIDGLLCRKS